MGTIKKKLENLYSDYWERLKNEIQKLENFEQFQHPHLLSTTEEFEKDWKNSDIRMMIFGIKTNGWGINDDDNDDNNIKINIYNIDKKTVIKELMENYKNFYYEGENWEYAQTFWNYFYCIQELLKCRLNKKISVIWNNVHKIEGAPREIENQYFNVTLEEVKIFRPNVILLLGIGERHTFLSNIFGQSNLNVEDYWDDEKRLYSLSLNSNNLDIKSEIKEYVKKIIITYHPNARGGSGIKMKHLIEHLFYELNSL